MILNIQQASMFRIHPDARFAKEYGVPPGTWTECWKRHKLLDYRQSDIRDYLFIKHARNLSYNSINRWIVRTEIFVIANPLVKKGVQHVNSSMFGKYEKDLMVELTKKMRSGGSGSSKTII